MNKLQGLTQENSFKDKIINPKVSVIVPVYGVEKYLRECLDSIVNQTLKDIEIICIDDGGKDNCPAILDEYAAKDSRIKVIHKENGGYGKAMNVGLDNVTGEYIGIVEPDDYIKPTMYEDLYKIASENDSDIVKSPFVTNYQFKKKSYQLSHKYSKENVPKGSFDIREYPQILTHHPSIWSAIYKTSFIKENNIKFVEVKGSGWADNPFFVQTACLAEKINLSFNNYYYWRVLDETWSKALKDYTIPFDRMNEIFDWAESQNIKTPVILATLYMRTLGYINIVLGMDKISDPKDCKKRIRAILKRMNSQIIKDYDIIEPYYKNLYIKLSKNLALYFFIKYIVKNLRLQNIFSIKNSYDQKHKVVTVCGIKMKFKKRVKNA